MRKAQQDKVKAEQEAQKAQEIQPETIKT